MTAGFFGRAPRVAVLCGVALLATATLTFAATSSVTPAAPEPAVAAAAPPTLVVPDVRGQAYVFAKSTLEQSGFAWRVNGSVQGFAANVVAGQTPAAGAKVVGRGFPVIVLRLSKNGSYGQDGLPENTSPYEGSPARLVRSKPATPRTASSTRLARKPALAKKPAQAKPAASKLKPARAAAPAKRPPAFLVRGAPQEPLDEVRLTVRVRRLAAWVEARPVRTPARVRHWLYQHTWIVTGARFGWSSGAEALRALIAVDRRVQKLWGLGGRSEIVARRALAEVQARSR